LCERFQLQEYVEGGFNWNEEEDNMKEGKLHYGWVVIYMGLLTAIAAHGFGRMSYTIILPAMKDGLEFNYTQLGLLGTGNFIGYLTMAIIGGFLAAHFGTRIVITAALILMGITMILTGLSQSFGFAFFMRLLTGLGNGASYVPAMALGSAWFTMKKRGFATGIVSAGIGIGTLISGLLVPPILSAFGANGWRFSWYILGGAVLLISGSGRSRVMLSDQIPRMLKKRPLQSGPIQLRVSLKRAPSGIWVLSIFSMAFLTLFTWLGRGLVGPGRWLKHLLRDDLGEDIRFAWKKPGGSTGLPCAGAFLHYLCAD
jgi:MFS family permease